MARSMCWHCQAEMKGEYFCDRCVKIQPLSKELDYFTCFQLPRILNIDPDQLESTFYQLSRTFHPDYYSNRDPLEQEISLSNAALLNTAYRTLKDPIHRAEYLIRLEAGSVKDIRSTPPADLFEEILTLQEDLEEYRSSDPEDSQTRDGLRGKLEQDLKTLEQRQEDLETGLFDLFKRWDALNTAGEASSKPDTQGPDAKGLEQEKDSLLTEMRELLSNRTYLRNIINDLAETLDLERSPSR